jgi:hypothetical protein
MDKDVSGLAGRAARVPWCSAARSRSCGRAAASAAAGAGCTEIVRMLEQDAGVVVGDGSG